MYNKGIIWRRKDHHESDTSGVNDKGEERKKLCRYDDETLIKFFQFKHIYRIHIMSKLIYGMMKIICLQKLASHFREND